MKTLSKLKKWFDIKLSWFFVNGRKADEHYEYLRKKYNKK